MSLAVSALELAAGGPGARTLTKVPWSEVDPALLRMLLSPWAVLVAFVWGAIWASFANVVIVRLPRGQSVVWPPSHCGQCSARIAWYDNLPLLSWLWLGGRCRACKARFGLRYLVVECAGGLLSAALYLTHVVGPMLHGAGLEGVARWLLGFGLALSLLIVIYVDLDAWIIPDAVVVPGAGVGLASALLWPALLGVPLRDALFAALAGLGLVVGLRALYLKWRGIEAMGLGDAKLLFMVGAWFGSAGLVWTIGVGALLGLGVAVPMLALGQAVANSTLEQAHGDDPVLARDRDDLLGARVPFGPFLALAALGWLFFGARLQPWLGALLAG